MAAGRAGRARVCAGGAGATARRCCAGSTATTWMRARGPIVNPFPLDRSRRQARAGAHHNPMERTGASAPAGTGPRCRPGSRAAIPDEEFNEIFARLPSHRDRALVAFYVSTGARAIGAAVGDVQGGVDPGRRRGHRDPQGLAAELQQLPASTGRVRVAAALPGGDGRADPGRARPAAVVDAAPPGAAADLSRGAPDVRAGVRARPGRRRRCTRCGTPPPTGWPRIRLCR